MKMFKNMVLVLTLLGAGSVSAMDVATALGVIRDAALVVEDGAVANLRLALTAIAGDMDTIETEAAIYDVLDAKFDALAKNTVAALDYKNIFYRIKAIIDGGVDLGENVADLIADTERNITQLLQATMLVFASKEALALALAERRAKQAEKEAAELRLEEARAAKVLAIAQEAALLARSQALITYGGELAVAHRGEAARHEAARLQATHTTALTVKGTQRVTARVAAETERIAAEEVAIDDLATV